jgi:hypothetical protein
MVYSNVPYGEEFRVMCCTHTTYPTDATWLANSSVIKISKDGGAWVDPTNNPVFIDKGIFSLLLTAEEMTADKIDMYGQHSPEANNVVSIFTSKKNNKKIENVMKYLNYTINKKFK